MRAASGKPRPADNLGLTDAISLSIIMASHNVVLHS